VSMCLLRTFIILKLSVLDLVKMPDLNQARVNKCLIALVNRKVVQKDSTSVSSLSLHVLPDNLIHALLGNCTVPLERLTLNLSFTSVAGFLLSNPPAWGIFRSFKLAIYLYHLRILGNLAF